MPETTLSSQNAYAQLVDSLGQDFVDQSLIMLCWFDRVLNVATQQQNAVASVLDDHTMSIDIAKDKIQNEIDSRHIEMFSWFSADSSIQEKLFAMEHMLDVYSGRVGVQSLEDCFYDYAAAITADGYLIWKHPILFGGEGEWQFTPSIPVDWGWTPHSYHTELLEKWSLYIDNVYKKCSTASQQEKLLLYFLNKLYLLQSGSSKGVWNSLNPMIQELILNSVVGKLVRPYGFFPRIIQNAKKKIPWTYEQIRWHMQKTWESLMTDYMFPSLPPIEITKTPGLIQ